MSGQTIRNRVKQTEVDDGERKDGLTTEARYPDILAFVTKPI